MTHAQALVRDGVSAAQAGNKVQARSLLRQAVDADPKSVVGWLWRAKLAADPVEAVECLRAVVALDPGNRAARAGLPAASVKAAAALADRDRPAARLLLREAIALDPGNETAWLWAAAVAATPADAVRCLERVLAINPQNAKAQRGLAGYAATRPAIACPLCDAAATHDHCTGCRAVISLTDPAAFDAPTGADESRLTAAVRRLTAAAADPTYPDAALHLGLAYLNLGRPADAIRVFAAATRGPLPPPWAADVRALAAHWKRTRPGDDRPLVIVADASPVVRKVASVALTAAGYRVATAADARELAAADSSAVAVVLDSEFAGRPPAGVPVLTLLPEGTRRRKDAASLSKPFRPDELTAAVARVVDPS